MTTSFPARRLADRLARFPAALRAAVACVTPEDARWKPASGAWSVLEVVNHLADEETDDFRFRLRFILEGRSGAWPPIDPEGWARDRSYNARDLAESVSRFADERAASAAWLDSVLPAAGWDLSATHASFGRMTAADFLCSWAAHDALHLRQIAKRIHDLARRDAGGYRIDYAGAWGA